MQITRRTTLLGAGAAVGALGACGAVAEDPGTGTGTGTGEVQVSNYSQNDVFLNDASRLSKTPINKHIILSQDPNKGLLAALRSELSQAKADRRPVNLAAARHSMGGHSIPRNGTAITFDNNLVEPGDGIYRAHAGARWLDVITALDPVGLSPKVMQSNNDFGVAASFSVNAHGWPTAFGPMGSTVRQVKILLADGSYVTASPRENSAIFNAAMGGYGLIGLIIEMELDAVPNTLVEPTFNRMDAENFATPFQTAARQSPMAFGRLNVDRGRFFQEASLVSFTEIEGEVPDAHGSELSFALARSIFRMQTSSELGKRVRWGLETNLAPTFVGKSSRSAQMNKSVAQINGSEQPRRSDILHEYFVSPDQFAAFIRVCRTIILDSNQDLLNVTLRWVEQDTKSMLSYAPNGPRIAAVMNFSQKLSSTAEDDAIVMTRRLIDAVHSLGGSYYLPYRPHATTSQFTSVYNRAAEFASLKRSLDPQLVFRNAFWDKYMAVI